MVRGYIIVSMTIITLIISGVFDFILGQSAFSLMQTIQANLPSLGKTVTLKTNSTIITNDTLQLQNVLSIQDSFRILYINKTDSHAGIVWSNGNKDYYTYIRPASNQLSVYISPDNRELSTKFIKDNSAKYGWYTLRVVFNNNTITVFLNNGSAIHVSKISPNVDISKVGIRTYNSAARFEPLKIVGAPLSNPCTFPQMGCLLQNLSH